MGPLRRLLILSICFPLLVHARGNTFTRVRYNGGSLATDVEASDWHNRLTVGPQAIVLALKDHQSITIGPSQVTSLSYGEEAMRRVGPTIGVSVVSFRFWPFLGPNRSRRPHFHFIGINYVNGEGKPQGLLLQGDNDNFGAILNALHRVTTKAVAVSEKERRQIPAGIEVQLVQTKAKEQKI